MIFHYNTFFISVVCYCTNHGTEHISGDRFQKIIITILNIMEEWENIVDAYFIIWLVGMWKEFLHESEDG